MSFVLDASTTLACYFDDERSGYTEALLMRLQKETLVVPAVLWEVEVANGLVGAERRKRLSATEVNAIRSALKKLSVEETLPAGAIDEAIAPSGRFYRQIYFIITSFMISKK